MVNGFVRFALASALLGQGFVALSERHGVKVFRRAVETGMELGAEGIIAAPPEAVRRTLLDYANHPRWVKSLAESRVLDRTDNSLHVYQRLGLPLIEDRDFTLRVTWGAEGQELWVRFQTANERGPAPRPGVVRVALHEGEWRLDPVDGGRATHAIYRFHLDLAGSLPSWLGKGRAAKDVTELFERLGAEAQRASTASP